MKKIVLFAAVALLAGCSPFNKKTIATVRATGVSERTVRKLEHRGILAPYDLIELKSHGVSDAVPIKQLDRVGVDYVVQRDDIKRLRSAGVGQVVMDALLDASDRFRSERSVPAGYYSYGYPPPWHYGGPWWWPDVTLGFVFGGGGHHHGHWR